MPQALLPPGELGREGTERNVKEMVPPLHPSFVRNVVYPIYRGLRGDRVLEILTDLESVQWLTPSELEDLQWRRLHRLLGRIATHVPYYRDLFAGNGIRVEDIQNLDDFRSIPLLSADAVRTESTRLISNDPFIRGYVARAGVATDASSFYCDDAAAPLRRSNTLRGYRWAGIDVGDRQVLFWDDGPGRHGGGRFAEAMRNYFNNVIYLSTFDLSEAALVRHLSRVRRFGPAIIVGYPTALERLAVHCGARGARFPRLKAVITSGERLAPAQRETIETALGAPVFDRYGCREFAVLAQECEERAGYHAFTDLFVIEVVGDDGRAAGPGEAGEIVVTDLNNYYMPLIRYRTGDYAVLTERVCPCGRGFPLLERVEGRSLDSVVTPSGGVVGGFFWLSLSRSVPGISRFFVEQRARDGVIVRIVPGPEWVDRYEGDLAARIRERCGDGFRVEFMLVDDIQSAAARSVRIVQSRIEEREVIKSKIHKAHVRAEDPEAIDCLAIDGDLMDRGAIAPYEKILIVDNTNGARVKTLAVAAERGSGAITAGGAVAKLIRAGDEISVMAFAWSDGADDTFSSFLVDENNGFIRYLNEESGAMP